MNEQRTMLLELSTGRRRPMRHGTPVCSSATRQWDGFLVEEYAPGEWTSRNVCLLNSAIFLTIDERAELEWQGNGKSVARRVMAGQISILPANSPYSVKLRAGGSVVVSLEPKLLACAAAEQGVIGEIEPVWVHGIDDALIRELVLGLRAEIRQNSGSNAGYAQSLAAALAAHVVRRYSTDRLRIPERPGGLTVQSLRTAIQYIHENLGEPLFIAQIASRTGLSAGHFTRMFKQSTGMAPQEYVLHCRVSYARRLLLDRSLSLAQVAGLAGFCDQAHMTRSFQRLLGTTPGAYLRSISAAADPR